MNTAKTIKKTTESFWNYYRGKPDEELIGGGNAAIKHSIKNSKSFDYKTGITGILEGDNTEKKLKLLPLKYLSNFWRTLDMPLTNCEVNPILTWSENCLLTRKVTRDKFISPDTNENPQFPEINNPTNVTFKITDTKLCQPVVTLSTKDDNNFLEQLKSGFKRAIKWNKYRPEITNQTKTNYLNYLINPTFTKVNRLFVLLFENEEDRTSFSKYYVPKVEIKDFNVIIDGKIFLMCQ